jgi:hypothetical protein
MQLVGVDTKGAGKQGAVAVDIAHRQVPGCRLIPRCVARSCAMQVIYGDQPVPLLRRPWPSVGVRHWRYLQPGERWASILAMPEGTTEHVALVDCIELPVGVAIAPNSCHTGAGWVYSAEVFGGRLLLVDHTACYLLVPDQIALVVKPLSEAPGSWRRFPDVVAAKGSTVVIRGAQLDGAETDSTPTSTTSPDLPERSSART